MKLKIFTLIPFLFMAADLNTLSSIYDYELKTIRGEDTTLQAYEGDVLLIVNTASKCGYTPQYEQLQKLYETYGEKGFTVLGFPSDNFGGQELDTEEEIVEFCEVNFGVTFPLFARSDVKGDSIHPLFADLTTMENSDFTGEIGWNFEKFLVDRNGNLLRRFKSNEEPMGDEIRSSIEEIL
ncbi:glutathione peroxidase [Rhodohalobacter sp. SW132]|nr:glutathione peroxidase [Rhodohalobacter sp. SW132]REL39156.1 glutathione peroxidase [Rhodohalobacter sp. SW132]